MLEVLSHIKLRTTSVETRRAYYYKSYRLDIAKNHAVNAVAQVLQIGEVQFQFYNKHYVSLCTYLPCNLN